MQGFLPPEYDGIRIPNNQDWEIEGCGFPEGEYDTPTRALCKVKEFKSSECGTKVVNGKAVAKFVPVVDLLVNFGKNKRGEIWNFCPSIRRQADLAQGGNILPKPYYEPLAKKGK